jgi:hypothetical protein
MTLTLTGCATAGEVEGVVKSSISQAFRAESATRQRDPWHLGISALSGCTRAAAHAIARTEPSDVVEAGEGRHANLGTWEHAGLLPRLTDQYEGGRNEVPVTLRAAGMNIPGHVDLDVPGAILDLKTVGEWRLQAVLRSGAFPGHVMQTAAYAVAKLQAGHPIQWLIIFYLDRANGDERVVVTPFTNEHVMLVIDRVAELKAWADNPDSAPRRDANGEPMYGPGFTFACNECPFLRRCWGDDARPNERGRQEFDNSEIESLLLEYVHLNGIAGPANRRKQQIDKLLETVRHGDYGPVRYKRSSESLVDDPHQALKILKILGYEVPQTWRKGPLSIRLIRTPVDKPPRSSRRKRTIEP